MTLNGAIAAKGLSAEQLDQIRELEQICNRHDGIKLKLVWSMLEKWSPQEANDWLFYEEGRLVGFLGLYAHSMAEVEINGMVHPDFRRRGVFSELVKWADAEIARRGYGKRLFLNQRPSEAGESFLKALGATYSFSEYWMELDKGARSSIPSTGSRDVSFAILKADNAHFETIVELDKRGFDMDEEDARNHVNNALKDEGTTILVAVVDGVPVGKLDYQLYDGTGFIYGFCMLPESRGRGYGRRLLEGTVQRIRSEEPGYKVVLEVATDNERALSLYESCGFRTNNVNDYYMWEVKGT